MINSSPATRRILFCLGVVRPRAAAAAAAQASPPPLLSRCFSSSSSSDASSSSSSHKLWVRIGHAEQELVDPETRSAAQRRQIPQGYLAAALAHDRAATLSHLQWLLQKDALQQDCLLVGASSASGAVQRRRLALAYAELTQRPVEFLTLSPDTTEGDLKQRRTLVQQLQRQRDEQQQQQQQQQTVTTTTTEIAFQDQAPVRAAVQGHLLILDGLQRAERNVLPTLNNLLENRELPLEDGRLLVSPDRFAHLLQQQQQQQQHNNNSNSSAAASSSFLLVPVHPDFSVLACMTVDPQQQQRRLLDPPVRSRFQIRRVDAASADALYEQLVQQQQPQHFGLEDTAAVATTTDHGAAATAATTTTTTTATTATSWHENAARQLAVFAAAMESSSSSDAISHSSARSLHFPVTALPFMHHVRTQFPQQPISDLLERAYPYASTESRLRSAVSQWPAAVAAKETLQRVCRELNLNLRTPHHDADDDKKQPQQLLCMSDDAVYELDRIEAIPGDSNHVQVHFQSLKPSKNENKHGLFGSIFDGNDPSPPRPKQVQVTVPSGGVALLQQSSSSSVVVVADLFVSTSGSRQVLTAMLQEHAAGRDILLVSPKGEGKNAVAEHFCALTGYNVHLFPLYKEMTATDLLIRRTAASSSSNNSSTEERPHDWAESPLLKAARSGQVCILDGVEKLSRDTFATLQGFLTDREVSLPDGTKYVKATGDVASQDDSSSVGTTLIHPSFRVIALASIAASGSRMQAPTWLSEEVTSMFATIALPAPSRQCLKDILRPHHSFIDSSELDKLLDFHERLLQSAEDCGVSPLSIRIMLRLVKRGNLVDGSSLYDNICSSLLAGLLYPTQRAALESVLRSSGIVGSNKPYMKKVRQEEKSAALKVEVDGNTLRIGDFSMARRESKNAELIPNPFFFDIPSHVRMIRTLLSEWSIGERAFLLLGNQGTGKNKICDRICELANFEREYIQLHRDSTIGQLTLSPSLEEGKIVWKDSPLVRAVTNGRALVIDEADKAPLEVVAVLKSLIEDGELLLADGRRILRNGVMGEESIITIHPDFTVWVLANRPGKLFHGNHFEIMDCFSSHVVPNPDLESEIMLLRSYAPSVDEALLRRVSASFGELRMMFEQGDISYPYSTREAVAVSRHLEKYPNDDVVAVLHNVLDLDSFTDQYVTLGEVFGRHGFPFETYETFKRAIGHSRDGVQLQIEYKTDRSSEGSNTPPPVSSPKIGKWDEKNEAHVGGNQWQGGTGGSDTAGLGGRGGPFRLDRGHKVHQVSDEAKAQVSEEAKVAARRIAQKGLTDRIQEIGINKSDYKTYTRFLEPIKGDIANLRAALQAVEHKASERDWIKRQLDGELDDSKLVEGIAGEKHVYKRRGTVDPTQSSILSMRRKRLRFVVDCSGSMYRFDGYDQRLQRCLQAAALIMEAGLDEKFDYSIVGHSGDSRRIDLVPFGEPPANIKERLRILQTMVAHSQFCQSGDNTVGAIQQAIADASSMQYSSDGAETENIHNDSVVIAISDANLKRYGISPRELSRAMQARSDSSSDTVKAYCIFIASFGDEAEALKRALPVGRGFVCMDSAELPGIVRNILTLEMT